MAWVKNDHLGFEIRYRKQGTAHMYRPDFIVKFGNRLQLVCDIKGQVGDADLKTAAAKRWVNAVNRDGRFGKWAYEIVMKPADLLKVIDRLAREVMQGAPAA